jgi:uncharacterized protein (TIGR02145 family)
MYKLLLCTITSLSLAFFLVACADNSKEVHSANDSKHIPEKTEVTIGNQVWMIKNLDVSTFRNGEMIPEAKTEKEWVKAGKDKKPAWCHYDNDTTNRMKYGKLYNWYAVNDSRGLAPMGWHTPTHEEWLSVIATLGGMEVAGKKMKSTSDWKNNSNGTNECGFSAIPAGSRNDYGQFYGLGEVGTWWGSTTLSADNPEAKNYYMSSDYGDIILESPNLKSKGASIRCIKD